MARPIFDDSGIGTETRHISWGDVVSVGIRTTGDGPWAEDLYWMFLLRDGLVEFPAALMNDEHMRVLGQNLPGLNYGKMIYAMGTARERMFRVWHHGNTPWRDDLYRDRFVRLVERLGGQAESAPDVFVDLVTQWCANARHYHNLEHLAECLSSLDNTGDTSPQRDPVELALWFHDAVYVAGAPDNEARSADLLLAESERLGIDRADALAAADLVRLTSHTAEPAALSPPAALLLDIDLSILGADPLRFMEYEHSIEEEFAHIPRDQFKVGRRQFLASLLARPHIFSTDTFRERYEATARAQLSALLDSSRYRVVAGTPGRVATSLRWLASLFSDPHW
jgi:predicted metal-dependent HD superfamily phosphohydrolase